MPELPEVERFKRYFDSTSLHKEIEEVEIRDERILEATSTRSLKLSCKGNEFVDSFRRGKYFFVRLSGTKWVLFHFGMSGFFNYYNNPDFCRKYERVRFNFSNGYILGFDCVRLLGSVRVLDDPEELIEEKHLGPDALSITWSEFRAGFSSRTGMIKPLLMNQSIVSGIGNLYADEILYHSKVHPEKRVDNLSESRLRLIFRQMNRVLNIAVSRNADFDKYPKSWLVINRTQGNSCHRCGGEVKAKKVGGRTSYFCSSCQKKQEIS